MNRSIITTPTNKRVFGACLLSFMILIAPIASVGAATLRATTPPANKQLSANEKMEAALFEPAPVGPPVPSVTATKTDSFPVHPGGKAQPGDQITYDIGITNAGTDATNATYTDTIDPNTTLVPGSLKVSPVAAADSYVAEKDVALSVAAGTGVLVNDFGTPAPTVGGITNPVCVDNTAPFTCTTTGGGTVVMEADGSFLYTPLVGFTGTDTFTYTATNSAAGGLAPDDTAVVTIEVDARPTVTTTTPADTATGVVTTANIVINFSESVTASTSSFTINCPAPGNAQAFTVTGSGTSTITLDPTGNLPAGTTCTVTVIASQISDVDSNDPPDLMSADYVFSFTTDAAPTVTNTTPVNGASSVPTDSNIVVTFSEAVTASGTAFTIECPAPGNAQAYSVSGSGTNTITVNPTSNLPNATLCTVTVLAAQVADTDTNDPPDNMAANFVFSFTTDGAPAVTTTVPTDTATGVAISSNITINFNEAVNATIASFSLECPVGSPKTFTVTGSGTSQIVLDPTVDLPIGTACRVTVIASQISDTDTADPPDNMVANYVFNFTTDFAPSVTATTPINGATQVANNTDVTVTFSEPVNVSGAWFSIVCGTSGTHDTTNSTVGGGPSTFTINPTDFANGESCTATIFAAQVSDQDTNDPPDNMAANFVFSFTVDNPPSVSSTTPINGATGVAANTNLTVTFSETVNVTGNWFQIVCGTQTKNPGDTVVTGGPTTFTINPNTDLLAGNICSVTVFAAQVTDQDSGDPPDNMTANHVFSFSVPPLAVNDAYAPSILGNVGVNTDNSTEFSVLANDTPTSGVTINQSGTSTQGGAVVVAADGKFSYIPPAGYEGPDSFTYTISNASGTSNSATVSFTVAGMIWFINAAAGPGDGRLATPFNSVASFQAVNDNGGGTHPGNGDNIFIYENASSYTGPITLLSNQKLIGQDATATLAAIAGVSVPADSFPLPAMNTGAPATTLSVSSAGVNVVNLNGAGTGNTVRGLTLTTGSATTKGISGTTFGTLTTADLIISGSGPAIDLTTGTLSGSFNSISSSGGVNGIRLSAINSASTIPFGTGALSGATAEEFFITGTNSTIALTYDGTISTTAAASRPVSISGKTTSGNVTFNGAISGTSSSGVLLDNNDGATITFRGGLALSTTTNTAFNAINGGTIEVCDENPCNPAATGALVNTLTTSTGVAINVNATTISANNLEFRSISSNGASSGIVLNTTGASGGLKVKGNSAGNCGGVVTPNAVGTPATITAPVLADCTGGSILNSTSDGVSLNSTNNVSLTRMRIQDSTDSGVFGNNVSGLSLVSSWFESNGDNTLAEDSGLEFQILTGTNNVTNCTISNNFEFSVNWTPSSGTGTLNISGTNIGPNPAGVGANGVHFTNSVGVGNSTLIITNSNVDGHQATGIQANASGSATQNIKIHNTTIKNNNIAIQLTSDTDADTNFNITNNTIIDHANFAIGLVPVSTSTNNSQFQGSISGNVIGDGSVDSGSRDAYGIRGDIRGDVDAIISVTNNTVRNTDIEAIFIEGRLDADADAQNGKLDLTVTGNDGFIPDDNSAFPFFTVYGSRIESRDTFNVCLDFGGSAALSNDAVGKALEDWRLRQRDTSTFRLERFVGSGTSDTDVEAFMLAQNPDLSSADATHATTYTGVANGTCRSPVIPAGIAMNLNPFDRNSEMLASNSESKSSIFGVTSGVGASVDFTSVTTGVAATSSVPNANPTARYDNVAAQIEAKGISQPELATAQSAVVRKSGESDQAISQAVSSRRAASFAKPTIVQNQKPVGSPGSAKQGFSHHARRTPKGASLTPRATTTTPVLNPACGVGTIAICLGTLKAGKTVNIQFKVTINTPFPGTEVTNQGSVGFDGGGPVLTDDPAVGGAADPTVTPVQTCTAPPVPANMVAWWSGDDTPRDIAGGNDGTLNGGMGYAAGKVLNGFGLDGTDDFVSAPDSAGLSPTQTISIDAWVNPDTLVADASGRTIVSKYDSSTAGESSYLLRMINGGQIEFVVYGPGGENRSVTTPGAISTGAFTHVAATFDNATDELKVYINGVDTAAPLGGGSTAITSINDSTTPVRIGALKEGASLAGFFDGVIDEVEIFNVVLTPAQVLDLFSADAGGKCKPSDLTITKTHTDPFVQGSTGNTYTITVHNDGPGSTAGTVTVIDTVPTGLTPTGPIGAHNGWNCSIVGQIVTCDRSDSLAASADYPTITLTVTAGANSASVINNVTVSGGGEMDTSDSSASDTTNLSPSSDLLSVKVEDVDPVTAGTNITYTITLTNNGPSDAQTVTLTDAVPANTTFVSFTQDTGPVFLCSMPSPGGTGNVSCSLATLPTGAVATFTMKVNVNAATPEGTIITNNAVAATTTNDPVPGNNTGTATTTVIQSDIEITSKTDTPDPVEAGSNITYTVNFKNNSAVNTASNVTVTDAVPTGTTLVSATTASVGWTRTDAVPGGGTGNIVFSKASVAGAETAVFTIVVKVDNSVTSGTIITNTATAATSSLDTVNSNNSASAMTTVVVNADLAVTSKTDTPDPVLASQNITYAINFQNNGPSDAQGVTITDAVPAGTTFVSAQVTSGTGWTIPSPPAVGGTGNVVFSKTTVAVGETATFEVVVKVNNNAVEGSIITNNAVAAGTTNDPTPGNNTGTATTTVNQSDIEITSKTDTPDPVEAGSNITYTVNFKNNSAVNTASNVTVTDAVPTGTTLVSATTASVGWARTDLLNAGDTGNIVFSKALVAASETAVFTIVVKVNTSVTSGTIVTNTATAATTSIDTVSANNSASATTTVVVNADLAVTSKTDTPDPVTASQNITYAINFVNNGPSDAQTVTVTDAVPTGTTFISASVTTGSGWAVADPGVGNTGNVVFSKTTVATGETATFEVVVKVNNNAVEGSIITNNAVAAGTTNDPTPGNNTGTATTTVRQSDIEITSKTDTPDPVNAGQNITYTVNFKNNSAFNTASNVTVTDAVPTGTTLVSATTASAGWARTDAVPVGGTGNIVFSKALVAVSETATFTIVVKVNANVLSGTTITNTATAATTSIDTNSANNSASATTTTATSADLQITSKTDAPDPVIAGENITYTINFTNNGPSDAQTVTVTDAVPANTTFVSAGITTGTGWSISSQPAVGSTGNVVFSKGTVAAGETATFQVVVKVNAGTPAATIISNDAVAASATTDPTPANNTGNATTTVVTSADLLVVKIDSPSPVVAGSNLTYTITVSNGGSSDAQNLSLGDTLPANTTFVSFTVPAGWTRTDAVPVGGTGTVTATAPTLVSGANAQFTLVVNVNAATPHNTVLTNSATATSTTSDPNPANNTGTVMTTVVSQPDLTISKSHTGNFAQGQVGATYTITVNNIGTGPTNGSTVTVTDNVPVGLTPTGPVGAHNGWTCSIVGQTLTCTRSDVLAGSSSYPAISLTVTVANPAPLTVTNTATVSGGGEVNTSNNSASDPTNIDCTQDFSLNNTGPLMISRFRMNGPAGTQDEFVEIYNPSTSAHTVASGNCGGGGYGVFASAGNGTISNNVSMVCQIPNGTVIPAGGYYLCTGATYSLSNLGRNGGVEGATSVSDAPIGCGGSCTADIPDDAGLALMNVAQGVTLSPGGGFQGGVPEAGFILYDKVGFGPYGAGAPAPGYPPLAGSFCEGAACLKPVGDASIGGACTNPSGLFPVVSVPPACYGLAGQYELLRRQTAFDPNLGTVHQDTNNSANDWILVAPNSGINMGVELTGVPGVTALHGAAAPQGSTAPADFPSVKLKQGPFGSGSTQLSAPNAERNYVLDPTVVDPANNPDGTFALRLRFTNNSGIPITGLRFRVDNISTLCGAQTGTPAVGSGSARNLAASPDCGGGGLTAILKLLNSAQELVVDSTSTIHAVLGTVVEDLSASATPTPPGAGALSPKGGGLDNSLIVNPSNNLASVGDGVTGGTGVFATAISTSDPNNVIRIKIKFGVVRSGRFIILITPAAKTAP